MIHPDPNDRLVAIAAGPQAYDGKPPWSPAERFPEYPFGDALTTDGGGGVYATVRESLRLLELDAKRFGTPEWNPLQGIVKPGDMVVLKPNLVRECRETLPGHADCTMTHGSVIRAVLDYVYLALDGRGRVVIADSPMDDADFEAIKTIAGLEDIQRFYREHADMNVEVIDLRLHHDRKVNGIIVGRDDLPGDPAGYVNVDLGKYSTFNEIQHLCDRLYGATYDVEETRRHHTGGRHEYLVSKTVLDADCVIEIPKLKTHKKVGITVNMKLLVGICGNKNYVAHYRVGVPSAGGDQFAAEGSRERLEYGVLGAFKKTFHLLGPLRRVLAAPLRKLGELVFGRTDQVVRSGNWHGNDTAWRMCHDLMRILLYADAEGRIHDRPVRRVFSVVDSIIAGEGNGPLDATPKPAGLILAGRWPGMIDIICGRLMGYEQQQIPLLSRASDSHPLPLMAIDREAIRCRSNDPMFDGALAALRSSLLEIRPHFGWRDRIEIERQPEEAAGGRT